MNRRRTQLKCLCFEDGGYCVWCKRLKAGTFHVRFDGAARGPIDARTLKLVIDGQEAINVPHFMNRDGSTTDLEEPIPGITLDYDAEALKAALEARGHVVSIRSQTSGLSNIEVVRKRFARTFGRGHDPSRTFLVGGADKRRDGTVGRR